jgi:hypothetical protein
VATYSDSNTYTTLLPLTGGGLAAASSEGPDLSCFSTTLELVQSTPSNIYASALY